MYTLKQLMIFCIFGLCIILCHANEDMFVIREDRETIIEAAEGVKEYAESCTLLSGCVVSDNPLSVVLEYMHPNDGFKLIHTFRPWRTMTWMMYNNTTHDCGVSSHVFYEGRTHHIVKTMRRAWSAYAKHAKGFDTLQPLTASGMNDFGYMGTTAVDSLDTLWLLGLKEQFAEASSIVKGSTYKKTVNVFETTIRILGGLLSAHLLTNEDWLLARAKELGEKLLYAFRKESVPYSDLNLETLEASNPSWGRSLSEAALTLEFKHLSHVLNESQFARAVDANDELFRKEVEKRGFSLLQPTFKIYPESLNWQGDLRLGGRVDSYYEYLLKEYVRSGDIRYRDSFVNAAYDMRKLYRNRSEFIFVGEETSLQMDHLVCFWPGTLALAIQEDVLPSDPFLKEAHLILKACLKMHVPPHNIAPEISSLSETDMYIKHQDAHNLLRPETLESLYMMWSLTKDEWYCEWSWNIFKDMEKAARVEHGYASIDDITLINLKHRNNMPSYFLAETIKYAWLCSKHIEMSSYILNTEAHFLSRVKT